MSDKPALVFWDLVEQALAVDGASKLHLTVGRPPMLRLAAGGFTPLEAEHPALTGTDVTMLLVRVVQPEHWEVAEQSGEGTLSLNAGGGRRLSLTFFRSSGNWSAVVHL